MSKILLGDCLEVLKSLEDESVDCCITSPPYYGLRDYGTGTWIGGDPNCPHFRTSHFSAKNKTEHKNLLEMKGVADSIDKKVCPLCGAVRKDQQIGLEETPEMYIEKLTAVFHEVKRVLKNDGTLWLNIGDSYWGSGSRGYDFTDKFTDASEIQKGSKGTTDLHNIPKLIGKTDTGIKNKDLIGIPWMLAFALRNDGWYLRQDIIWHKPNPMPESVKDRCTKSHEYIFLLSKKSHYYFDYESIQEDAKPGSKSRYNYIFNQGKQQESFRPDGATNTMGMKEWHDKRNKRDVWSVVAKSVREAHFATFPEELITPCILAGCRTGGTVLDPFFGSGTTGRVATKYNREYIGIELNPDYVEISNKRTDNVQMDILGFLGKG